MAQLHLPAATGLPGFAIGAEPTMSSREIAELVGSRHDKVKQSIERLADRGTIVRPPLGDERTVDAMGRPRFEGVYKIGKRDSFVIVAQLSPEFTARLVDRWQELETGLMALPQDYPAALRRLAAAAEQIQQQNALISTMAPKADALDVLVATKEMILITDGAKRLGIQPKDLFAYLRENAWIYRRRGSKRDIGHEVKIRQGLLVHKYNPVPQEDGTTIYKEQVHLTPKGLAKLAELLGRKVSP